MTGDGLSVGLIGFYVFLASVYAYEGAWPKASYWLCAAGITGSVLWMK